MKKLTAEKCRTDRVMSHSEMLDVLRNGVGFCGWGADQHTINHSKEHVWFKKIDGGYTECCAYGDACSHHKILEQQESEGATND